MRAAFVGLMLTFGTSLLLGSAALLRDNSVSQHAVALAIGLPIAGSLCFVAAALVIASVDRRQ